MALSDWKRRFYGPGSDAEAQFLKDCYEQGINAADLLALVTDPVEVTIDDTPYGAGWNGDTTTIASKNALYDKISSLRDVQMFKQTVYLPAANITTTSSTYTAIDGTNLPALALTLAVGDVVDLSFTATIMNQTPGNIVQFDWTVDQPTSADVNTRGTKQQTGSFAINAASTNSQTIRGVFVATEAGAHTFLIKWKVPSGTGQINGNDPNYNSPIIHRATNLGPSS